jgi:hypothetical protein
MAVFVNESTLLVLGIDQTLLQGFSPWVNLLYLLEE